MNNLILAAVLTAILGQSASAAPNLMTYQGRLKESGAPVTGTRQVNIYLCDALTAGLCTPTGEQPVAVTNSLFRTTFAVPGSINLEVGTWYLEVRLGAGGGTILSPREQLTASPFAMVATSATSVAAEGIRSGTLGSGVVFGDNVGIGTSSPQTKLDVVGGAAFGSGVTRSTFSVTGVLTLAAPLATGQGGTGNVNGTAAALTANGANCVAGNAPLGVDASGTVEGCYDVGTQTELDAHTGGTSVHSATSLNTASRIVMRDASGNFSAGTITASLSGTASNASAIPATGVTAGALPAGVTITPSGVNLSTVTTALVLHASLAGTSAHSATSANTASAIVARDASGNFSAGTITANLTGNVTGNAGTATALAANPTDCGANQYANAIAANGNLTCAAIADADVPNNITVNATGIAAGTLAAAVVAQTVQLVSGTKAVLLGTVPGAVGKLYYCSDCSGGVGGAGAVVVSTGAAAGQFAMADGGPFQ